MIFFMFSTHKLSMTEDPHATCDRQDIVRAGITQAIGVVAVIDHDGLLLAISENHCCHAWVKKEVGLADIEVISVMDVFYDDIGLAIRKGMEYCRNEQPPKDMTQVCDIFFARKTYVTMLLQPNGKLVVEIEDFNREKLVVNPILDTSNVISKLTINTRQVDTVNALCKCLFKKCSYDRAMTYKFLDDLSGEVVFELKNDALVESSFLGLRFPAGDIPLPARKAYIENPVRFIADVEKPSLSLIQKSKDVLLARSFLRGCVGVHKNYLKNMGVKSSLSIAITNMRGELWGLICLHSYSQTIVPTIEERASFKILASVASSHVQHIDYSERIVREAQVDELLSMMSTKMSFGVFIVKHTARVLETFRIQSVSLFMPDGSPTIVGEHAVTLEELPMGHENLAYGTVQGPPRSFACFRYHNVTVVFTRVLLAKEVSWAGNPRSVTRISPDMVMPRKSFEKYVHHASHNPPPFTEQDKFLFTKAASAIKTFVHQERVEATERKIVEARRENDLAEMKSGEDYAFFANMSHELRTPLHAITGVFDIIHELENDDGLLENVRSYTKIGIDTCRDMLRTLDDILTVVKKTHEGKQDQVLLVMVKELFHSTSGGLKILSAKNNVRFRLTFARNSDKLVRVNVQKTTQIFNNICGNAIKFSARNGAVDVEVHLIETSSMVKDLWDSVSAKYASRHCETCAAFAEEKDVYSTLKKWLVFTVADNGCGISEYNLPKIFQRFRQIGDFVTKSFSSTGLGLYITQSDVKAMRGLIYVASTLSKGSLFFCALPVEAVASDEAVVHDQKKEKVLLTGVATPFESRDVVFVVVDDSKVNLMIAKKQIEKAFVNATVHQAANGKLAVEEIRRLMSEGVDVDGIFMDYHMPVMSGLEATRQIKSMYTEIPVAMLTADITEISRQSMVASGADFVLLKPSRPLEVAEMCVKMIQLKAS